MDTTALFGDGYPNSLQKATAEHQLLTQSILELM